MYPFQEHSHYSNNKCTTGNDKCIMVGVSPIHSCLLACSPHLDTVNSKTSHCWIRRPTRPPPLRFGRPKIRHCRKRIICPRYHLIRQGTSRPLIRQQDQSPDRTPHDDCQSVEVIEQVAKEQLTLIEGGQPSTGIGTKGWSTLGHGNHWCKSMGIYHASKMIPY